MKNSIISLVAFGFYAFLSIATSKKQPIIPTCYDNLNVWFLQDSSRSYSARIEQNQTRPLLADTVVCRVNDTTRTVNWSMVADSICAKVKRDCGRSGFPILIANSANPNRQTWNTQWGKTILLRTCL